MNEKEIISGCVDFVKNSLKDAEAGHDWHHIERVHKNALLLAQRHECNMLVLELAALLHDIADAKFHDGDDSIGPKVARAWLEKELGDEEIVDHVVAIIENVSFKGGNAKKTHDSIELDLVQDADRLDAIGAIGIARAFHFGGFKNRPLYDPDFDHRTDMSAEEYRTRKTPSVNHFYEKLLLLKDRMNTEGGKELATKRHEHMEAFLDQFHAEWRGER